VTRIFEWPPKPNFDLPSAFVGVTLQILPQNGGWHTAIIYQTEPGRARILHHQGHYGRSLLHEPPNDGQLCVLCPIDEVQVPAITRIFRRIYAANIGGLPYAFSSSSGAWFGGNGRILQVGAGMGLCCQTFVMAAFAAANFPLIDRDDSPRRPDDAARQLYIIEKWRDQINQAELRTRRHFQIVEANVGTPLFRPWEVCAAAATDGLRCPFSQAIDCGKIVRAVTRLNLRLRWTNVRRVVCQLLNLVLTDRRLAAVRNKVWRR
jgi:hypothetical protein